MSSADPRSRRLSDNIEHRRSYAQLGPRSRRLSDNIEHRRLYAQLGGVLR
jgi:hypothetical protein